MRGPAAFNLELAYQVNERLTVAGKYEGSSDLPALPERQVGLAASYEIFAHTALALEYLYGTFESAAIKDRSLLTGQVAVKF